MSPEERKELNDLWMKVPPHNQRAHGGMAASQTGIVRGCYACRLLKLPHDQILQALRKRNWRERWAKGAEK